ncbi:MAG TPA: hypothetical protein VD837_07040 [Terriglobales bacterium]|nr:hypothetical protein [Terriglobales bacterium]
MSFFSGSTSAKPGNFQNAMGVQTYRASSSESARPVPYLMGRQRIALTYISDCFDTRTQHVGGGGKSSTREGTNYYTSFAALACFGPVDALHAVFLNGDPVYTERTNIVIILLTSAAGVATATTRNEHNLTTGDSVVIVGASQQEYVGTFVITVTADNKFTFAITGTPQSPATAPNNGKIYARVVLPPIFRDEDNPDYVDITIPDYGVMRLYWGTETQEPDDYLLSSGVDHPAYRGLCYAVFHRLYLGFNQTNVQNIELVLGRYPERDWLEAEEINGDTGLISLVADLLQSPRAGLRLPDEKIDTATMLETAATLADEGFGFSPLLTREQETRQVIISALEYFDGYLSFTADGKLGVKLVRPPVGALPEVTDTDLVEKPTFEPDDWSEAFNETTVRFTNRSLDYKEDSVSRPDSGLRNITGEPKSQSLDRPWITDGATAEALQRSAGRAGALPQLTGTLKLRMDSELFDALTPGEPFTLDYSGRNTDQLIFRVVTRTVQDPARPVFEIQFKADRSYVYA